MRSFNRKDPNYAPRILDYRTTIVGLSIKVVGRGTVRPARIDYHYILSENVGYTRVICLSFQWYHVNSRRAVTSRLGVEGRVQGVFNINLSTADGHQLLNQLTRSGLNLSIFKSSNDDLTCHHCYSNYCLFNGRHVFTYLSWGFCKMCCSSYRAIDFTH